ncbi:MAG TPA: VCBS repeat-containing protein [Vicinamibacterales bacterium]|nr:VCBS repeat-containing protein [Vicinamibacterales bacterium]
MSRLRLRPIVVILVLSAATLWPAWRTIVPAAHGMDAWTAPVGDVEPALRALLPDEGRDIVSAITADIDADGDLDVVASDSNLELLVWVNDGNGNLSRQDANRNRSWASEPTAPSVENRPTGSVASVQTDPPTVVVDARASFDVQQPARRVARRPAVASVHLLASSRTPRAPPLALPI